MCNCCSLLCNVYFLINICIYINSLCNSCLFNSPIFIVPTAWLQSLSATVICNLSWSEMDRSNIANQHLFFCLSDTNVAHWAVGKLSWFCSAQSNQTGLGRNEGVPQSFYVSNVGELSFLHFGQVLVTLQVLCQLVGSQFDSQYDQYQALFLQPTFANTQGPCSTCGLLRPSLTIFFINYEYALLCCTWRWLHIDKHWHDPIFVGINYFVCKLFHL